MRQAFWLRLQVNLRNGTSLVYSTSASSSAAARWMGKLGS
jgi:hypothetical protein